MNEYTYDDILIGMTESFSKRITPEMEDAFRAITGDENPLHKDDVYAVQVSGGKFERHVAFGMLTASLYSTVAGMYLPGKYSLIHSLENVDFKKPVFAGDELFVTVTVKDKQDDLHLIILDVVIRNQNNKVVSKASMKVLVQK